MYLQMKFSADCTCRSYIGHQLCYKLEWSSLEIWRFSSNLVVDFGFTLIIIYVHCHHRTMRNMDENVPNQLSNRFLIAKDAGLVVSSVFFIVLCSTVNDVLLCFLDYEK
jgi:hypothetical protein